MSKTRRNKLSQLLTARAKDRHGNAKRSMVDNFSPESGKILIDRQRYVYVPRSKRQEISYISNQVSSLNELMNYLVAAMVITDSPTLTSAQAYEGLRSSVIQASRDRNRLLVTLASLDFAFSEGQDPETIHSKIEEEMERSGLTKTFVTSQSEQTLDYYDFENDKFHNSMIEVVKPAYIDRETGSLVRTGTARWVQSPELEIETTQSVAEFPDANQATESPNNGQDASSISSQDDSNSQTTNNSGAGKKEEGDQK